MIILEKMLIAFVSDIFYNFFFFLIIYTLYKIKGKDLPDEYRNMSPYIFFTNLILIFLILVFFRVGGQ